MPGTRFRVHVLGLNLRSRPEVAPSTRKAVLPQGHEVEKLSVASDPEWWEVATTLGGTPVGGFVVHRCLEPVPEPEPEPVALEVPPVHLGEDRPDVTRARQAGRAFPLGEAGRPARPGGGTAERVAALGAIVEWLAVDNPQHLRYQRQGSTTFCNIYAYDYCYLAGAYLPRVWWTGPALQRLAAGEVPAVKYGSTVSELNANSLFDWLNAFGPTFGWRRVFDPGELQGAANEGAVCIICAQRTQLERSGHIVGVVPETPEHRALGGGQVTTPLQSQAGWSNFRYGTARWWVDSKFRDSGFWLVG